MYALLLTDGTVIMPRDGVANTSASATLGQRWLREDSGEESVIIYVA